MGSRRSLELQQLSDHVAHLRLQRGAATDDRLLDDRGRIFSDGDASDFGSKQDHTACMTQHYRSADVLSVERTFNGDGFGSVGVEEGDHSVKKRSESGGQGIAGGCSQRSAFYQPRMPAWSALDDAVS